MLKLFVTLAALGHLAYLTAGLFLGYLGANPVEVVTHETGEWGLNFLILTLLVTPVRKLFHWSGAIRLRRFLGLWGFAYSGLHFLILLVFDHFFNWQSILADIIDRPYITVGFTAFVIMIPLAITSMKFWMRKLGKRWFRLHSAIYVVVVLAVVHYWWLVKADFLEPIIYTAVVLILFAMRFYWFYQKKIMRHDKAIA